MAKLNAAKTHQKAGLTLIGVLVATLIFGFMLLAIFNLMARTTKEVGRSREEFIAANLATEGLELVRYIRDSNWLAGGSVSWAGNAVGTNGSAALCHAPSTEPFQLTIDREPVSDTVRVNFINQNTSAPFALYKHHYPSPVTFDNYEHGVVLGQKSVYNRRVEIDCTNFSTTDNEHIIVTSIVTWNSRGQDHEVRLREHLYNWYQ